METKLTRRFWFERLLVLLFAHADHMSEAFRLQAYVRETFFELLVVRLCWQIFFFEVLAYWSRNLRMKQVQSEFSIDTDSPCARAFASTFVFASFWTDHDFTILASSRLWANPSSGSILLALSFGSLFCRIERNKQSAIHDLLDLEWLQDFLMAVHFTEQCFERRLEKRSGGPLFGRLFEKGERHSTNGVPRSVWGDSRRHRRGGTGLLSELEQRHNHVRT